MADPEILPNTLFGTFESPTPEQLARVAKLFDCGDSDGSPFQELVRAIDAQLLRSGRKFRGVAKHNVIAKIIFARILRGDTDEGLVAGVELMKKPQGAIMLEELFAQRPASVEAGPSTGVTNGPRHAPPASSQFPLQLLPSPPPNMGVPGEANVIFRSRMPPESARNEGDMFGVPTRRHARSISLDSPRRFMACPACGFDHIPIMPGMSLIDLLHHLAPMAGPVGPVYAAHLRWNNMNAAALDEPRAVTVGDVNIQVPRVSGFVYGRRSSGLLEFMTAGILVCLLVIVAHLVSEKASL